jgi:hypothetical protein
MPERLDLKQALFRQLDELAKPESILASQHLVSGNGDRKRSSLFDGGSHSPEIWFSHDSE